MREISGKTAFVTGAASGIGFALARGLAQAGARVMLADIEPAALLRAVDALRAEGAAVDAVACDVTQAADLQAAAQATVERFGKVHILCNNAGVGGGSGADAIDLETWRWVLDVNLMGVVHGLRAFLPHIRAHGEGGHILNTASLAGFQAGIGLSPYVASKYAVVGISEGLALELAPENIGVSILAPGFVRTDIANAARNRQPRYGAPRPPAPGSRAAELAVHLAQRAAEGLDPAAIASRAINAIRANELYVFTHADMRGEVDERLAGIAAALDRAGV